MTIDEFIKGLSNYSSSDTVTNMYHGNSKEAIACRQNLKDFLEKNKNAQILLVGEAPGYKGCARTGVPFTTDKTEITANAIHEVLDKEKPSHPILMWNAFPFHPHKKGDGNSNRKPNASELAVGYIHLNNLLLIFPNLICFAAIGKTAEKQLKKLAPFNNPVYVRHPAHGGKTECQTQLKEVLARFDKNIAESEPYKGWPRWISKDEHAEYLDQIKLEYITFAECERLDPYYDSASSPWGIMLHLNVHGYRCYTHHIYDKKYYKKFEEMIRESGEFGCESEVPMQYGRIVYRRKK